MKNIVVYSGCVVIGVLCSISGYGVIEDAQFNGMGLLVVFATTMSWTTSVNIINSVVEQYKEDKKVMQHLSKELKQEKDS